MLRLRLAMSRSATIVLLLLLCPALLTAQEEEPSLGDVARQARQAKAEQAAQPEARKVIDDDNFSKVLDEAETARVSGKPVFSIDSLKKTFRMTSPDGTCSLSFDARATSLISSAFVTTDLPQDEVTKLEATASIHDDVVELSVRNDSAWEVREVVIGITVLHKTQADVNVVGSSPTPTESKMVSDPTWTGKQPDQTAIYHLRGSAGTKTSASFTAPLSGGILLSATQDWHWALISARGIPPASPATLQSAAVLGGSNSSQAATTAGNASTPDSVSAPIH